MAKSIMEDPKNRACWACGAYAPEEHHVFYGVANRKKSEKYGLKVHLCSRHHRDNLDGVHGQNKKLDQKLKEARVKIVILAKQVIKDALELLGIQCPEQM